MLRHTRSIYTEFYDPDGLRFGMPTYPYRSAPAGWLTRRQLRAKDLRPGGPAPGRAGPVEAPRQAAPGQPVPRIAGAAGAADDAGEVRGAGRALVARCTCPRCGRVMRYCIPVSVGWCNDCDRGAPVTRRLRRRARRFARRHPLVATRRRHRPGPVRRPRRPSGRRPPATVTAAAGGPYTPTSWAQAFIGGLHDPETACNIGAVAASEGRGGRRVERAAAANPLNTTQPEPGRGRSIRRCTGATRRRAESQNPGRPAIPSASTPARSPPGPRRHRQADAGPCAASPRGNGYSQPAAEPWPGGGGPGRKEPQMTTTTASAASGTGSPPAC